MSRIVQRQLPPLIFCSASLAILIRLSTCESVHIGFGHWLQPLISRTDNLTVLNNSDIKVQLTCTASYPTEWVADFDDEDANARDGGRLRLEWTDRKFTTSIDEPSYNYIAWVHLEYTQLQEEETLTCRSVANHSDNVFVRLQPDTNLRQLQITNYPGSGPAAAKETTADDLALCKVNFEIAQVAGGHYWRVRLAPSPASKASIRFHDCETAAYCANMFRSLRTRASCVTTITNVSAADIITDPSWSALEKHAQPGLAVYTLPESGETGGPERVAVEYFFDGKTAEGHPRKLRLSQPGAQMRDLIYMDPIKDTFYTREILNTSCLVPKYGFSFDPVVIVTLNGSRLLQIRNYEEVEEEKLWRKNVTINLPSFGPGIYEIHCIAPVWNTTEWANLTRTLRVREVRPPSLQSEIKFVNITFESGDTNKSLVCDATGDPPPDVTWKGHSGIPGIQTNGSVLTFNRISAVLEDGANITCTAENDFGQKVSKFFEVHLKKIPENPAANASISTIIIVVGLLFGALLVAGFVFLYFRFLKLGSAIASYLPYEEVKEFREGKKGVAPVAKSSSGYMNAEAMKMQKEEDEQALAIDCLPYNSEFEVAKDNLFVDMTSELGSGEYGIVYKGYIKMNARDRNPIQVAVKTVRKNVHVNYFKALMSELKILAYIGHHDNIVNLIGAYSSNVKNRELFVGVELCKTSLLRFLQDNRQAFKNFVQHSTLLTHETSFSDYQTHGIANSATMTTFDLIRWAAEVAAGMEFLTKKRVVHGDLAARNILVSYDLRAKICDFGLARQLIDYNYIKSQQCPLPWKWMAIESLSQMKFSIMSDVWAYGITLWELFSLGNVPYPGLTWNMDFMDQLKNGLRMTKPTYASEAIFTTMLECWRENPKERPKFSDLKQFFQSLEVK